MLPEHLSQRHDRASRRFEKIDRHVGWIHTEILAGAPSRVLDLGCGPGLYTLRLASLGHQCVGIDFSPASIEHAREQARAERGRCTYIEDDIRTAAYGENFDLGLLIFGEFNAFRPADAKKILQKSRVALARGGTLLLEVHSAEAIEGRGRRQPWWYTAQSGLFSERPHLCLWEGFWDPTQRTATERYFIVDLETSAVQQLATTAQAYADEQYRAVLDECGFDAIEFRPAMGALEEDREEGLFAILARSSAA